MQPLTKRQSPNARLLVEVGASGLLAFIIVSLVFSVTSPAPLSLAYMVSLA